MNHFEEASKTTLTFRLPPMLKEELAEEASEQGLTTSSYVEQLLAARHDAPAPQEEDEEPLEHLHEQEATIAKLEQQIGALQARTREQEQQLAHLQTLAKQAYHPSKIAAEDWTFLQNKYPDYTPQQLMDLVILCTSTNEKSTFSFYHLADLLRKKPHLLTALTTPQ